MSKIRDICAVVTNDIDHDYRVQKECNSLAKKYRVQVLGFRQKSRKRVEHRNGIRMIRTGEPILRRLFMWLMPSVRDKVTLSEEAAEQPNNLRVLLNDLVLFSLFLNKNISVLKRLLFIKADAYHANDLDTLMPALIVARLRGAKLVYDSHELCVEDGFIRSDFVKSIQSMIEGVAIRRADAVITVNDFIAEELKNRYNLKTKPLVIMNFPGMQQGMSKLKIKYRRAGSPLVLLYHGFVAPGRGVEELILSMKYVDGAVLQIRSFGPTLDSLKRLAEKNKLAAKVRFLDIIPQKEVISSASQADIGVIPYRQTCLNNYYCSPNKLFEYMAAGLCILASDLPVLRQFTVEKGTGCVYNSNDPKKIAAAINRLVNSKSILSNCKRKSLMQAKQASWEKQEGKLLGLYDSIQ